jgi:hypothetical protein
MIIAIDGPAALMGEAPLQIEQGLAHLGMGGDHGGGFAHFPAAQPVLVEAMVTILPASMGGSSISEKRGASLGPKAKRV